MTLPAERIAFAELLAARSRILAADLRLDQLPKKFRMTMNDTADMILELLTHMEDKKNPYNDVAQTPAEERIKALNELSENQKDAAPQLSTAAVLKLAALDALAQLDQELGVEMKWPEDQAIDGYKLVCTCGACPEQYDVFDANGQQVGYLRLRHGYFRAEAPDVAGEIVYDANTKGDGVFEDDERETHLRRAVAAINAWCQRARRFG